MKTPLTASRRLLGLTLLVLCCAGRFIPAHALSLAPATCTELAQNGGFEAGGLGWQQFSAQGYELVSDFNPRTGSLGIYLAGVNNADDRLSQPIIVPAAALTVTLSAWWFLATAEIAGTFDTMTVSLLGPGGAPLADLLTVDNSATVGIWDEIVLDLTAYAGQTVVIQFAARTDANNISDFYLDDVSVMACAAIVTPTATATSTPSPTPTVTPTATATRTATQTATPTAPVTATPTATRTAISTATNGATQTVTVTSCPTVTPTATPHKVFARYYLPYLSITGGSQ